MEVLILILAIAVVVGFFIVNDSGAKALEVLDEAKQKDDKPKTEEPVKKVTPAKPKPVKAAVTKATPVVAAPKPAPKPAQKPASTAGSKNNRNKRKKT